MIAQIPFDIAQLERLYAAMPPDQKAAAMAQLGDIANALWVSQPGPQMEAFFSPADELLYGGAAGGGKTDLAVGLAVTAHRRSVVFRRQAVDLEGIWDRLTEIVQDRYTSTNSVKKRMTLFDGRLVEMGHLEAPGAEKTWQGRAHDLIAFDEAAQQDEFKVNFVMQWLRSTSAGQRCRVLFATNPPIPDMKNGRMVDVSTGDWLKRWFGPWIDPRHPQPAEPGELRWCFMRSVGDRLETVWVEGPGWYVRDTGEYHSTDPTEAEKDTLALSAAKSRTFIKSRVDDNVFLRGTGYKDRLSATPEPLRSMLMDGRFGIKLADHKMQVIATNQVLKAQDRWLQRQREYDLGQRAIPPMSVLAADIAQGGIDHTVYAPLLEDNFFTETTSFPGIETPTGVEVVERLLSTRKNNARIVLDNGGGYGGSTRDLLLTHHRIRAIMFNASNKSTAWTEDQTLRYYNMRAQVWWRFREALRDESGEEICLPPDDRLLSQLTAVHWGLRGNQILIESKDDVRARIGTSTDEADAVIMAWANQHLAIAERHVVDPVSVANGGWNAGVQRTDPRTHQAELDDPLAEFHL